ncbi:MAG: SDR family oxidoreductase [Treponema sp.]|jgi:NAD(P)-dependent dehydrogenase (short-subunit alcohol dehydrogenase family)|nr:SDR family oxidoreductase [Treponema sp.]
MKFSGKVVIITGAGRGLGKACAKAFAHEGARVVLAGRTFAKVEAAAAEIIKDGGQALPVLCDVSNYADVKNCVAETVKRYGTVDVVINNAAVQQTRPVVETDIEEWDKQIKTNLYGSFFFCREVLPVMIKNRYGKIINISSSAAKHFFPGFGAYAASKAGIAGLSNILSEEVKEYGINVNTIYLGLTRTEAVTGRVGIDPAVDQPPDKMMTPEEAAKVILFVASDDGKPFVGSGLDVFGLLP